MAQLTEREKAYLEAAGRFRQEGSGYFMIQGSRPQTLAYGLTDSPVGQLAFDRPAAVSSAQALLTSAGVANRCSITTGNFFQTIPLGGDVYILRHTLHDWSDERCLALLRVCRAAVGAHARLLIIERTVAEDVQLALSVLHADLEMLVMCVGKERTQAQYADLLASAGFRLSDAIATGEEPPHTIYEAVPV